MLLPHCCRFLALPTAKIIQFRATRASLLLHFYLCDPRRMERKNPLDTLAVGDAAHSECFVESASFATNHNASKYLDSFFVSFHDSRVNAYAIANRKLRQIAFFLFFLDSIDDLVHKLVQATRLRGAHSHSEVSTLQLEFVLLMALGNSSTSTITSRSLRRNYL